MKFNIIKNELHNIMRSQLKRVDGEVSALADRIKRLDEGLERSEEYIRTATAALQDATQYQVSLGRGSILTNTGCNFCSWSTAARKRRRRAL